MTSQRWAGRLTPSATPDTYSNARLSKAIAYAVSTLARK